MVSDKRSSDTNEYQRYTLSTTIFKIISFVKPFWLHCCAIVSVSLYWSIDATLRPYIMKWMMNAASHGVHEGVVYELGWYSFLFCFTLLILIGFFRLYDIALMRMEPVLRTHISAQLMEYAMGHSHAFYQRYMSGGLSNHVSAVVRGVPQLVVLALGRGVATVAALLIALTSMWFFYPPLAYVMGVWVIGFIAVSCAAVRRATVLTDAASDAQSNATGAITDTFANMYVVRLFAGASHESNLLQGEFNKTAAAEQARDWLLVKIQAFYTITFILLEVVTLGMLVREFSHGWVTPGDFSLILGINLSLIWVLWGLIQDLTAFVKAFGEVSQGLETIMAPHEMPDEIGAQPLTNVRGTIAFQSVTFGTVPHDPLFRNFSLTIPEGQSIGFVGYSGSGKSTCVNLILRLFDVHEGSITLDGHDLRSVTQESIRRSIAFIPQDSSLFHRSLWDNIRYGRPDATNEEVIEAAKQAHAHEFIMQLKDGYDTIVGERGMTLSGGQRQRISIARAFIKRAPIVIMDEATSALDSVTEQCIQDSIQTLMKGRTTIVIAHRLSTLMHMDRIVVFERGKIIEDGTHASLLALGGAYSRLWNAQICGFLPGHTV